MTYICELAEVHFRPAIGPAVRVYAFSSLYSPVSSRRIHVTFAQTSLSGMQCHSLSLLSLLCTYSPQAQNSIG